MADIKNSIKKNILSHKIYLLLFSHCFFSKMSANPFDDVLGMTQVGQAPGTGDPSSGQTGPNIYGDEAYFNIDDTTFAKDENEWATKDLILKLDVAETDPPDCFDKCQERFKQRAKNCAAVRKRVVAALKKAGCPTVAKAGKVTRTCGGRGYYSSATSTTTGTGTSSGTGTGGVFGRPTGGNTTGTGGGGGSGTGGGAMDIDNNIGTGTGTAQNPIVIP